MGRHTLRTRPPSPTQRSKTGNVMIGGAADDGPRWTHWVRIDAETRQYRYGKAWVAVCDALCVPAGADYLKRLQACPECDRRERGFSHHAEAAQ